MNFINRLFKSGKKASTQNEEADICRILLPSFLAVMLCAACLVGSTFAWFSSATSSSTQTIQAANYQIKVEVQNEDTPASLKGDTYTLDSGKTYTVTLTATGTSSNGGYAIITLGENVGYSQQLNVKEDMTFTVIVPSDVTGTMKVSYSWGTCSDTTRIVNKATIDYPTLPGAVQS